MTFGSLFSICQKNISVNPNVKLKCEPKQSEIMYTALHTHVPKSLAGKSECMCNSN